jgi:cytochrome P450
VSEYDPFSPESMADPYPTYRELREAGPVHPLPQYDAVALPRFAEVWEVLNDLETFSVVEGPVFVRDQLLKPSPLRQSDPVNNIDGSFAMWDPPLHTQIRKVMRPSLQPRWVASLEDRVRELARARLDELVPQGRFDVAREYTAPVVVMVACEILGFPSEEGPALVSIVNRSSQRVEGHSGQSDDGRVAQAELAAFAIAQVRARRKKTIIEKRVVDYLIEGEIGGRKLTDEQIAIHLISLLVGGTETLPKVLAGGVRELGMAPDQRCALVADPTRAADGFEEMVRHQGVLQSIGRTLTRPVEIAGTKLRAGQRIFLLLQSANRDAREFPDPDRFDMTRRPLRHVGFGRGQHHCIGIHAARLEGYVLLQEFLARVPDYEVLEAEALRPPSDFQLGYTSLPVLCKNSAGGNPN